MAIIVETLNDAGEVVEVVEPDSLPAPAASPDGVSAPPAPAASPALAPADTPAVSAPAPVPVPDEEGEDGEAVPRGVQRRFDRLTRQREEARRDAQTLRERLARLEGQMQPATPPPSPQPSQPAEPQPDAYATESEYLSALVDYRTGQKVHEALAARDVATRQQQEQTLQQERQQTLQQREDTFRAQHTDYDEQVGRLGESGLTPQLYQALMMSEAAPDLAYYLAQHPDTLRRIAPLPPLQVIRELGKLEAQLTPSAAVPPGTRTASPSPTPKPAPLTPVGSGGSGAPLPDVSRAGPEVSQKEWEEAYDKTYGNKGRSMRG